MTKFKKVQKVAVRREFEAEFRHATIGKLGQPSSKWVPFSELGKDKEAKGKRWAPPFISSAQDTVALKLPLLLRLLGYGTPLPIKKPHAQFHYVHKMCIKSPPPHTHTHFLAAHSALAFALFMLSLAAPIKNIWLRL